MGSAQSSNGARRMNIFRAIGLCLLLIPALVGFAIAVVFLGGTVLMCWYSGDYTTEGRLLSLGLSLLFAGVSGIALYAFRAVYDRWS